jgi:hypothetical protein
MAVGATDSCAAKLKSFSTSNGLLAPLKRSVWVAVSRALPLSGDSTQFPDTERIFTSGNSVISQTMGSSTRLSVKWKKGQPGGARRSWALVQPARNARTSSSTAFFSDSVASVVSTRSTVSCGDATDPCWAAAAKYSEV